jgi:hypothetical protein
VVGCCEFGSEPSGSIKSVEFLDQLCDYRLVKMVRLSMELEV